MSSGVFASSTQARFWHLSADSLRTIRGRNYRGASDLVGSQSDDSDAHRLVCSGLQYEVLYGFSIQFIAAITEHIRKHFQSKSSKRVPNTVTRTAQMLFHRVMLKLDASFQRKASSTIGNGGGGVSGESGDKESVKEGLDKDYARYLQRRTLGFHAQLHPLALAAVCVMIACKVDNIGYVTQLIRAYVSARLRDGMHATEKVCQAHTANPEKKSQKPVVKSCPVLLGGMMNFAPHELKVLQLIRFHLTVHHPELAVDAIIGFIFQGSAGGGSGGAKMLLEALRAHESTRYAQVKTKVLYGFLVATQKAAKHFLNSLYLDRDVMFIATPAQLALCAVLYGCFQTISAKNPSSSPDGPTFAGFLDATIAAIIGANDGATGVYSDLLVHPVTMALREYIADQTLSNVPIPNDTKMDASAGNSGSSTGNDSGGSSTNSSSSLASRLQAVAALGVAEDAKDTNDGYIGAFHGKSLSAEQKRCLAGRLRSEECVARVRLMFSRMQSIAHAHTRTQWVQNTLASFDTSAPSHPDGMYRITMAGSQESLMCAHPLQLCHLFCQCDWKEPKSLDDSQPPVKKR